MTHLGRMDLLDRELRSRVVELVEKITGEEPTLRTRNEVRFGRKGSLSVNVGLHRGRITSFDGDGKGKSPLQYIAEEKGLSWPEAIRWAAGWLNIDLDEEIERDPVRERQERERRARQRREKDLAAIDGLSDERKGRVTPETVPVARAIVTACRKVLGDYEKAQG